MKKTILIALFSLLLTIISYGSNKQTIEVVIKNLKDYEILVKVYDIAHKRVLFDSIIYSKKGKFSFNKKFTEPVHVIFVPKSGLLDTKKIRGIVERETMTIGVYVTEGEKYTISGNLNGLMLYYSISGSEINSVLSNLRNKYLDAEKYADMESEYFRDDKTKEERDSVYRIGEKDRHNMKIERLSYLQNHTESQLSGLFISEVGNQIFDDYYDKIDESVRNGIFKPLIDSKKRYSDLIKTSRKMVAGANAIDFTLKGLDDNSITLSSLKGGYVLLYFWGSW